MSSSRINDLKNAGAEELQRQYDEIDSLGLDPEKDKGQIALLQYQASQAMDTILNSAESKDLKNAHDLAMSIVANIKA
jgi:hypothetical protein